MASPTFFSDGSAPRMTDTRWAILQKILGATLDITGGGGTPAVTVAAGSPPVNGSVATLFYKDSSTGFKYINVGTVAVPAWEAI